MSTDSENWKEKYYALEATLVKFKSQAGRIRELLCDKTSQLEQRINEAVKRAELAEARNTELEAEIEKQLQNDPDRSTLEKLKKEVESKDQEVELLRSQLERQESKVIQQKSVAIRDFVARKMTDLERQNEEFKEDNAELRNQVQILRARLNTLSSPAARELHRLSVTETGLNNTAPEQPQQFDNSNQQHPIGSGTIDENNTKDSSEELSDEADYQEIDEKRESRFGPSCHSMTSSTCSNNSHLVKSAPPQVRIERKLFNANLVSSITSSMTSHGSEDALGSTGSPMTQSQEDGSTGQDKDEPPSYSNAIPPSGDVITGAVSPLTSVSNARTMQSATVSALATLPRRKKPGSSKYSPVHHVYDHAVVSKELEYYERENLVRRRMSAPKPPTPPMRRLPSWESRIYGVANRGMQAVEREGRTRYRDSSSAVSDGTYSAKLFDDLQVPVYTNFHGRATQIRSNPFVCETSAESSSSSDDDVTSTTFSQRSPSCRSSPLKEHLRSPSRTPPAPRRGHCSPLLSRADARKSPRMNRATTGALKRAASHQSVGSESGDYAVPPDEEVALQTDSDTSEPEVKLLKYAADSTTKNLLETRGWLYKIGSKKSWKKRYFSLHKESLVYYKSPNELSRKPKGCINLDANTRVTKGDVSTFEIATAKRTYYLAADTSVEMEHWIKVIQNVLKSHATTCLLKHSRSKETLKGWVIKAHNGRSRRCWWVLMGRILMYYKNPGDATPLGQIHLRDARVEEVDRSADSESDSDQDTSGVPDYTLCIWPFQQGPTYLMLPTKHEKDTWLYHLTLATGGKSGNTGTDFEQLVGKLVETDGDPNCAAWRHALLLHSKEPLTSSLTSLSSSFLQQRAMELFKNVHSFTNARIESPQMDYHIQLGQATLDTSLTYPELQNEVYAQLVKQTSKHPPEPKSAVQNLLCGGGGFFLCDTSPTSPTNSVADLSESKHNPPSHVILQGWQLMALVVSSFAPTQNILFLLNHHLRRHADPRTDVGKYAVFCQRALERTVLSGAREARPSRMEVISFDSSTTVGEFLTLLNKSLGMRDCDLSGFALFTDDPGSLELEHCLQPSLKLCDVISRWELACQQFQDRSFTAEGNRSIRITYKNRLYLRELARSETERERLLWVYQVNEEIVAGRFPVNKDLAVEMAALLAQIDYGDYRLGEESAGRGGGGRLTPPQSHQQLGAVVERFFPRTHREWAPHQAKELEQRLGDAWCSLRGRTCSECVRIYLNVARKWPFCGSKLFSVKTHSTRPRDLWLAVQEESVCLLDYYLLTLVTAYPYSSVLTFGGYQDDFLLVVNRSVDSTEGKRRMRTQKLLFTTSKPKIVEITTLLSCYINKRSCMPKQKSRLASGSFSNHSDHTLRHASSSNHACETLKQVTDVMEV